MNLVEATAALVVRAAVLATAAVELAVVTTVLKCMDKTGGSTVTAAAANGLETTTIDLLFSSSHSLSLELVSLMIRLILLAAWTLAWVAAM